ncbi:hypothetical protein R1sor_023056 [Riccia sorocarpa]|uniref:Uncharacterized protein n=1 Tax=Riccia sorocarpa TaxID=122646 RepID=A0ABD3GLK2_9MARC
MNVPTPPPKKHQSVSATPLPRKQQYVTPSPPPRKKPVVVEEVTTEEEEEESESEGNDDGVGAAAVEEESDSPPAKKVNTKGDSKLKTLNEMEPVAGIDREKQEKRRKAVERCRVGVARDGMKPRRNYQNMRTKGVSINSSTCSKMFW